MGKVTSTTTKQQPIAKHRRKGNDYYQQVQALTTYLEGAKTFDKIEHPAICAMFNLPYLPDVFAKVYHRRMLDTIITHGPITAATISKFTGIQHKYICQIKRAQCNEKLIYVSHLGKCPTTGSLNVQFLAAYE